MTPLYVTDLPIGYDQDAKLVLNASNEIVVTHPIMPALIYDESVMRWVQINIADNHEKRI